MRSKAINLCRKSNVRLILSIIGLIALVVLCSGCYEDVGRFARKNSRSIYGAHSKSYEEFVGDPIALATVKTVVFVPFDYLGRIQGFDSMTFTTKFANQMATQAEVRVIYPREFMKLCENENRKVSTHNKILAERVMMDVDLNTLPRDERTQARKLNPISNVEDAVKLGRMIKADAVVMGRVSEWDPYMRPRMALTVDVVATGNSDTAAQALAQMTQWGVPRQASSNARGPIWFVQQNFDSRDPDIGRNVWNYGYGKHTEDRASNISSYIRSMTEFYDYVGTCMAKEVLRARKKAVKEAQRRAIEEAKKKKLAQEGVHNKLRALTDVNYHVPDSQAVMDRTLADRRDMSWRPDIYNLQHEDKKKALNKHVDPRLVEEQYNAMR